MVTKVKFNLSLPVEVRQKLKLLSACRNTPMQDIVSELIEREYDTLEIRVVKEE